MYGDLARISSRGQSTPDEFLVFKPTLKQGKYPILQKRLGEKEKTMVYTAGGTINQDTPADKRRAFILTDNELILLAQWALAIEEHYNRPMDIEWAKDGPTEKLYIVQARPETVQSRKNPSSPKNTQS
ncbi:PEP/pyruvate-binding domain-containing protein [Puia sp. P3]|uniref:PEP/pyruvate-binding domain-containing protein n=1 Tax=Puia sp. P3 TaxID=3423952 RepID=UPI003D67BCC3